MSTTEAGNSVAILSSTNSTPIAVTAIGHGFSTSDVVSIAGHLVNTKANGEWTITVIGPDAFQLNSSVGNGVGGATGTVTSFVGSVQKPSDGDGPIKAADVNPAFEGLADRAMMLYQAFKGYLLGLFPIVPSRTITRVQTGTPTFNASEWNVFVGKWETVNNAGVLIQFPIDLPHGSKWTNYEVYIQPGVHAAVPATPYTVLPLRVNMNTGVVTTPAGFASSVPDPAVNITQYDGFHGVGESGGTEIVDRETYRYFIEVASESGANSINVTTVFGPVTECDVSALDVGAS